MATTTIRRFGVLSVGKQLGLTYALIGLIIGLIGAGIYNLVAGATGGIEVELTTAAGAPGYGA